MFIISRFKQLNQRVKLLIVVGGLFITIILIISAIYSIKTAQEHNQIVDHTPRIDEHSGQEIFHGQKAPELSQIPGAPTIYGLANLLDRGIDNGNVQIVKAILSTHYAQQNQTANTISTVSISKPDNIQHTKDAAGYHVYTVSLLINDEYEKILQLTIGSNRLIIKIGDNSDSLTTLYDN